MATIEAVASSNVILRPIQPEDRPGAVELMAELRITIGGLQTRALYRAMTGSPEICCVVARQANRIAGIALVELNRNWIRRRPLLAARMVLVRFVLSRLRRHSSEASQPSVSHSSASAKPFALAKNPPLRWSDNAPRVLFIGVHPNWRGQGIGKLLYNAMFDQIRALGGKCILARVAVDNIASLHLHNETGWRLYEDDGVVFAFKDLQTASSRA
jgi:ribosomal protein S18 acetylase RimI-like enzyme